MRLTHTIVSKIEGVDPDGPGRHSVRFENGERARLEVTTPRGGALLDVIGELRDLDVPAFVRLNPANGLVTTVLIPLVTVVRSLERLPSGDIEVRIEGSVARHVLRARCARFQELADTLTQAQAQRAVVAITEIPGRHEIADVRIAHEAALLYDVAPEPPTRAVERVDISTVSEREARRLFRMVEGLKCAVPSPSAGCIPFMYPDDGCWARAHEMCRLMKQEGYTAGKIWIYGDLRVETANHPRCAVRWVCHVAPVLNVRETSTRLFAIDPSLFDAPVPAETWKGIQGDPDAESVVTGLSVFDRSAEGHVKRDPDYRATAKVLAFYRMRLRRRAMRNPPPYRHCTLPRPRPHA